jgi:hypothetical protein
MKKNLLLICGLIGLTHLNAQNDTLLWADFETDPGVYILNGFPPGTTGDADWYNYDNDGQNDGSGAGRPLEWFWSGGFSIADSAQGVLASSSWTNGPTPTENWVITPSLAISDSSGLLSWKSAPYQTPRYLDGYLVLVSTATNDFADFTDTVFRAGEYVSLDNPNDDADFSSYTFTNGFVHGQDGLYTEFDPGSDSSRLLGVLRPHTVSLKQYAGQSIYIAFVHYSVDDNLISIDDVLVMEADSLTLGKKEPVAASTFRMFPNPANDKFTIDMNLVNSSDVLVSIYDLSGRKVMVENLGNISAGQHQRGMNIQSLSNGIYQVQVETSEGTFNSRLQVR